MNILEVAVRKFISSLSVLRLFVVYAEIPLRIFIEPMLRDELIFLLRCGSMLAPGISVIVYVVSRSDELFGMLECHCA